MNRSRRVSTVLLTVSLIVLTVAVAVISLGFGAEKIPIETVIDVLQGRLSGSPVSGPANTIIWELRLPRALLAIVTGAGLAIAGALMQTLVRNPLADPYILGISSGAAVGATAVITMGVFSAFGIWSLSVGALCGALGSSLLVYFIAQTQGGLTPLRLVLGGVVLSAAFSSVSSFLVFLSDNQRAANSVMFWTLGSVAGATWQKLIMPVVVVVLSLLLVLGFSSWLDALAAGPHTAAALGINVTLVRNSIFILNAILVGSLVAVSGGIGFVGLIVPHASRILVGALHRKVIPVATVGGALFLLVVDVIARTVASPQEMPLGVVTGIIGAPLFLFLMGRNRYAFGGRDA
ncbi:iron ABC transporter permease [Corynebacterium pyruviciproducens]|nr:iron ABC transporter permease [Corynebacterium glucuronolyticum]MDH4657696.1 iron ABC transporter permease [Corynebacterium pyruviciproducens]